jgi:hypothetical protein
VLLQRGQQRGTVPADADLDVLTDNVTGAVIYRRVSSQNAQMPTRRAATNHALPPDWPAPSHMIDQTTNLPGPVASALQMSGPFLAAEFSFERRSRHPMTWGIRLTCKNLGLQVGWS